MSAKDATSSLVEGVASRKRSHSHISRSSSRGESPWQALQSTSRAVPTPTEHLQASLRPLSHGRPPPQARFAGDGFHFRRPAMPDRRSSSRPTLTSAATPPVDPAVIDLTEDVESVPSRSTSPATSYSPSSVPPQLQRQVTRQARRRQGRSSRSTNPRNARPPRFGRDIMAGSPELIDLSDIDDEIEVASIGEENNNQVRAPPQLASEQSNDSSDVEFISEREIPQRLLPIPTRTNAQSQPVAANLFQPFVQGFSAIRDRLMSGARFRRDGPIGEGEGLPGRHPYHEEMNRLVQAVGNQVGQRRHAQPPFRDFVAPVPVEIELFGDGDINMDYAAAAFAVGGVVDTDDDSATPDRSSSPYKAPPAAQEGFTRKIEEDDVVVCSHCSDELGAGEGEIKRQVWVSKQCGHGYCGECVANRWIVKGANKKDKKAAAQRKTLSFKTCTALNCDKLVSAKTAMVQIYL